MKKEAKLSLKRVFMFAIMLIIICLSTTTIEGKEENLLAIEDIPYYEGKYNNINFVANLIDKIDKDDILISPFNINSTLAALYNIDYNLNNYFQDQIDNVNNNYLSKMTKYKKSIKKKTKKETFYEKCIQELYSKQYDTITLKSLSKMGNIDKKELITLLDTIILSKESLTNKNITLKQLKNYKPRNNDYNINNQTIFNKINTVLFDYDLYNMKNNIINISNIYYKTNSNKIDLSYLNDKYLINTYVTDFSNTKEINNNIYNDSNKQVNYIVDDKDLDNNSLITSSFVFNYKWDTIIENIKNTYDDFYVNDEIISVEMLNFTSTNYLENASAQGFIKDYDKNKYSFIGILPKNNYGLSSINVENLLKSRVDVNTNVSIPKFSIVDTNNIMSFSNIDSIALSKDDSSIKIDKYYQKNLFSFKEGGTFDIKSKTINGNNIATLSTVDNIVFNHPFYFMIIDNNNNSILLAGKITNPNI